MLPYAAFHLGLHCLPKYLFPVSYERNALVKYIPIKKPFTLLRFMEHRQIVPEPDQTLHNAASDQVL